MTRVLCWMFLFYMGYRRVWVTCEREQADRRACRYMLLARVRTGNDERWPQRYLIRGLDAATDQGGPGKRWVDYQYARRVWAHKTHINAARSGHFSFRFQDRLTRT